jgi:hypothetical protein
MGPLAKRKIFDGGIGFNSWFAEVKMDVKQLGASELLEKSPGMLLEEKKQGIAKRLLAVEKIPGVKYTRQEEEQMKAKQELYLKSAEGAKEFRILSQTFSNRVCGLANHNVAT